MPVGKAGVRRKQPSPEQVYKMRQSEENPWGAPPEEHKTGGLSNEPASVFAGPSAAETTPASVFGGPSSAGSAVGSAVAAAFGGPGGSAASPATFGGPASAASAASPAAFGGGRRAHDHRRAHDAAFVEDGRRAPRHARGTTGHARSVVKKGRSIERTRLTGRARLGPQR